MSSNDSRIHSEVDFDAQGKHHGFLRLPHSVHRSAYGWLPVPVVSVRNGKGPTALLMSGNHGDEYEGQVALSKLCRAIEPQAITGQIIILPMANYPAARSGRRTSPIDKGNLNRSFPGDPNGSPTSMMAHYIEHELLPRADLMIDLHSGGSSLMYLPSVLIGAPADRAPSPEVEELARLFGAPFTQAIVSGGEDRMSMAAAARQGVMHFTTELAGSGTVSRDALQIAEHGTARVLHKFGILNALDGIPEPGPTRRVVVRYDEHYCYSSDVGLFEPLVDLGDEVRKGQPAAAVHMPETPWREPTVIPFNGNGVVVCKRIPGRVQRGDCLFHLGE